MIATPLRGEQQTSARDFVKSEDRTAETAGHTKDQWREPP